MDNILKVVVERTRHGVLKWEEGAGRKYKHKVNILVYFPELLCAKCDSRFCWLEATAPGQMYLHGRMGHCLHGCSEPAGNKLNYLSEMELSFAFCMTGVFSGGK